MKKPHEICTIYFLKKLSDEETATLGLYLNRMGVGDQCKAMPWFTKIAPLFSLNGDFVNEDVKQAVSELISKRIEPLLK